MNLEPVGILFISHLKSYYPLMSLLTLSCIKKKKNRERSVVLQVWYWFGCDYYTQFLPNIYSIFKRFVLLFRLTAAEVYMFETREGENPLSFKAFESISNTRLLDLTPHFSFRPIFSLALVSLSLKHMRLQTALDRDMRSLQSSVVTAVSSEYKERHGNAFSLSVGFAFMLMMHKSTDCKRTVMPCECVNRHKRHLSEYVEFAMNLMH